jgi:hypothetical protein
VGLLPLLLRGGIRRKDDRRRTDEIYKAVALTHWDQVDDERSRPEPECGNW